MSDKVKPDESWPFEDDEVLKKCKDGEFPKEYIRMRLNFLNDFILRYGSIRVSFDKKHFKDWFSYIIAVTNVYHILLKKMDKDSSYKLENYEKTALSCASGIRNAVWEIFSNYDFAN